jgi:hypothetical protein
MADGSQPVYGAMSNEQIALEGMVQGLDDYAAVGRLEAIRRLERLEGSLPEGVPSTKNTDTCRSFCARPNSGRRADRAVFDFMRFKKSDRLNYLLAVKVASSFATCWAILCSSPGS